MLENGHTLLSAKIGYMSKNRHFLLKHLIFIMKLQYKVIDGNLGISGKKFTIPFYILLFME